MDFYASDDDQLELLKFVFDELDGQLFETYSPFDQELRRFENLSAVRECLETTGVVSSQLSFCPASCLQAMQISRVELDPVKIRTANFRHHADGWGLIHLHLPRTREKIIRSSSLGVNSRFFATKWEPYHPEMMPADAWDWADVGRVANRLRRKIKSLSIGKHEGYPLLAGAASHAQAGGALQFL